MQRLKERVSGAVEQDEEERWRAERDLERRFRKESSWPALKFECSMLQTLVEGADGAVSWRELKCGTSSSSGASASARGDVDDFEMLWNPAWIFPAIFVSLR